MLLLICIFFSVAWAQFDPSCVDKLDNCDQFPETSCKDPYESWAKQNCNNTCKFCNGPPKPSAPCKNSVDNCDQYQKSTCTDPKFDHWSKTTCRYFCRKCSAAELALKDSQKTTIPPTSCKDKLDCRLYGKGSCGGTFAGWAKENCMAYCGICKGVPTPPHACVDKIPNCATYQAEACTSKDYAVWAQDHCAKHCGLCGGGSGPVATPPGVKPVTSGPGHMTPPPIVHNVPTPPHPPFPGRK